MPPSTTPTAVVGRTQDVVTTNPVMFTDLTSSSIVTQVFEHLLTLDDQLRYTADKMITSWKVGPQGDFVDFDLKPGMTFHDGTPLTAADAVFTFEGAIDEANRSPRRSQMIIRGKEMVFEATGAHQLRVWLPEDSAACLSAVGGLPILPKHRYEGHTLFDHPMNRHPVGSGPYALERWVPDEELVLRAYDGYHASKARIERVAFRTCDSVETAVEQLVSGEVDYVPGVPPALARDVEAAGARVRWNDAAMVSYLALNLENPHLADVRTRRAVAHAIDRQALVAAAVAGAGAVTDTLVPPGSYWRNDAITPLEYDVRKAARLLDEAGFTRDGTSPWRRDSGGGTLRLEILTVSGDRTKETAARCIASDLRAVGIEVDVVGMPMSDLLNKRVYPRTYDAAVMAVNPDPDPGFLNIFYHSEMLTPVGWNRFGYRNFKVDELLASGAALSQPREARKGFLDQVQAVVAAEVPHVTLYNPTMANVVSPRIEVPDELAPHGDDFKSLVRWRWAPAAG